MLVYPQLRSGAVTQFPFQKKHGRRTVINVLADGSTIKLADPSGETTGWQLQYKDLSDEEVSALEAFFESAEGSLNVFTFLDPTSNLFAWSDHLDHAEWTKGPLLALSGGQADPAGGTNGWRLSNSGAAAQSLTQIIAGPEAYTYCLSLYAKSATASAAPALVLGATRKDCALADTWSRVTCSGSGNAGAETVEFGIEVPAGVSLDVYGMQVEPQAGASVYKPSTRGGVYSSAWFRDDHLAITATDVNRHSATVNILHAIRL